MDMGVVYKLRYFIYILVGTILLWVIVYIILLFNEIKEFNYAGDGDFYDLGHTVQSHRYWLELGTIDITKKGEYSYDIEELPDKGLSLYLVYDIDGRPYDEDMISYISKNLYLSMSILRLQDKYLGSFNGTLSKMESGSNIKSRFYQIPINLSFMEKQPTLQSWNYGGYQFSNKPGFLSFILSFGKVGRHQVKINIIEPVRENYNIHGKIRVFIAGGDW